MAVANYSPPAEALIKATRADFDRRDVVLPVHLVQYDDTLPVLAVALYKGRAALDTAHWRGCQPADG